MGEYERNRLMVVIASLLKRVGGEVTLNPAEIVIDPEVAVIINHLPDGNMQVRLMKTAEAAKRAIAAHKAAGNLKSIEFPQA